MAWQGYQDNTEHNYLMAFVFKKIGGKFPEISDEEIEMLAKKSSKQNTVKATNMLMNVWRSWAETRVLTVTFSKMKLKNWTNVTLDSLLKFAKASVVCPCSTTKLTPVCQTVVHHFYGCQVTINNGAGVGCFSIKQQLNTGRSLPLAYLHLWFHFTTAVTAKTVIWKFLSLNHFMLFTFNGL